ncbi:MAG: hypothetical protein C4346_13760, partial [Chloroflexota bacterium]
MPVLLRRGVLVAPVCAGIASLAGGAAFTLCATGALISRITCLPRLSTCFLTGILGLPIRRLPLSDLPAAWPCAPVSGASILLSSLIRRGILTRLRIGSLTGLAGLTALLLAVLSTGLLLASGVTLLRIGGRCVARSTSVAPLRRTRLLHLLGKLLLGDDLLTGLLDRIAKLPQSLLRWLATLAQAFGGLPRGIRKL